MHKHRDNTHASATPACDGKHAYCVFMVQDALWVTAVNVVGSAEGKIAWQTKAGDYESMHGYGSSPVLYKSLVIVQGDNPRGGFLAALHAESGQIAWKVRRENAASFATPVVAHVAGQDQLLLSGQQKVASYNPVTGDVLWTSEGPAQFTANTVACSDKLVFATGGYPENAVLAIKADGSGEVVWRKAIKAYVPSPLLLGERLLVVQDSGTAILLDADTGGEIWTQRLGGNFYASPVVAGDTVYVPDRSGMMHVFKAGPKFVEVSENFLASGGDASPVICGGRIYIRTTNRLYCVGTAG
jgi:outer membrane protein assembly factor BamB